MWYSVGAQGACLLPLRPCGSVRSAPRPRAWCRLRRPGAARPAVTRPSRAPAHEAHALGRAVLFACSAPCARARTRQRSLAASRVAPLPPSRPKRPRLCCHLPCRRAAVAALAPPPCGAGCVSRCVRVTCASPRPRVFPPPILPLLEPPYSRKNP